MKMFEILDHFPELVDFMYENHKYQCLYNFVIIQRIDQYISAISLEKPLIQLFKSDFSEVGIQ